MSERGIGFWRYVPQLFDWPAELDHSPCPLDLTYQLARNVMAACVREQGAIETERAHALLVYDAQNPAFRPGDVADAVRVPSHLRGAPAQAELKIVGVVNAAIQEPAPLSPGTEAPGTAGILPAPFRLTRKQEEPAGSRRSQDTAPFPQHGAPQIFYVDIRQHTGEIVFPAL